MANKADPRAFRALTAAALFVGVAASGSAWAQSGPTRSASATATAEIVEPLQVTQGLELAFGLLKGGSSNGYVAVTPDGRRIPYGGAEMVGSGPCHETYCEDDVHTSNAQSASYWGPGQFQVRGNPGTAYRVAVPTTVGTYNRTPAKGRIPELVARDFRVITRNTGQATGVLDGLGADSFRLGGSVDVPANMRTGSYRVLVPVTVEYP